jgi:hypothetical protein
MLELVTDLGAAHIDGHALIGAPPFERHFGLAIARILLLIRRRVTLRVDGSTNTLSRPALAMRASSWKGLP